MNACDRPLIDAQTPIKKPISLRIWKHIGMITTDTTSLILVIYSIAPIESGS